MKILLVDVDSTIPNLALMKISAYYKSKGHEVGFNINDPDKIYASIIFKKNKDKANHLKYMYPNAEIDIGGSGYDLYKSLPVEIDDETPDYSIYPNCDRYYGFSTRGCIRNCSFCIVPKKEGKFHKAHCKYGGDTPAELIQGMTGQSLDSTKYAWNKIEFMDNNILADKDWFMDLTQEILNIEHTSKRRMYVDFNQGLDIRLMDDEIASRIHQLAPITKWKFAFDNMAYKDKVKRGIDILNENGVKVRDKCMFYVYTHEDAVFDDSLERCRLLKSWLAQPYVMLNMDCERTQRLTDLKRWCMPPIFWSCDYDGYIRNKRNKPHK